MHEVSEGNAGTPSHTAVWKPNLASLRGLHPPPRLLVLLSAISWQTQAPQRKGGDVEGGQATVQGAEEGGLRKGLTTLADHPDGVSP